MLAGVIYECQPYEACELLTFSMRAGSGGMCERHTAVFCSMATR